MLKLNFYAFAENIWSRLEIFLFVLFNYNFSPGVIIHYTYYPNDSKKLE